MFISQYTFLNEDPSHACAIEEVNAEAFGPARHARAAARVREQGPHDNKLSFVCLDGEEIIGSVRMTPIWIGQTGGYLLGPLAVRPSYKKRGIGGQLIKMALNAIKNPTEGVVILVGDQAYYGPKGFIPVGNGAIEFPGPVDANRILSISLAHQDVMNLSGQISYRSIALTIPHEGQNHQECCKP